MKILDIKNKALAYNNFFFYMVTIQYVKILVFTTIAKFNIWNN
jgi:hypothetical protein